MPNEPQTSRPQAVPAQNCPRKSTQIQEQSQGEFQAQDQSSSQVEAAGAKHPPQGEFEAPDHSSPVETAAVKSPQGELQAQEQSSPEVETAGVKPPHGEPQTQEQSPPIETAAVIPQVELPSQQAQFEGKLQAREQQSSSPVEPPSQQAQFEGKLQAREQQPSPPVETAGIKSPPPVEPPSQQAQFEGEFHAQEQQPSPPVKPPSQQEQSSPQVGTDTVGSLSLVEPPSLVNPPSRVQPPSLITPSVDPSLAKLLQQQLEGLERVDIRPFVGIANLQETIDSQSQELRKGVSTQQYLVFQPVTKADRAKIESTRSSIGGHTRMTHYTDSNLLIIKMPTLKHESAHLRLGTKLMLKVVNMGIPEDMLCPCGGTKYPGRVSSKEGDSSYKPSSREKETDWPSIIFEAGYSESIQHLRSSARWWLENSQGEVKIAVIISIHPADKRLHIEKWGLASPDQGRPATRGTQVQTLIPTQMQEVTILPNNAISGSLPLVLGFQDIFLRPAIPPESDVTFTAEDLLNWAEAFWKTVR